ncbi:MAG: DUF1624 domain-containing protein [Bryobacterales bacterium]|nr:DUF1624 domain-containing protein [Bryobacterales bacterium]
MRKSRIQSIDLVRGAVMILMAIDHVREYLSSAAYTFRPEDLSRTTAAIFLSRWVTHFCAPVFMFTAGLGAFLWARRGRSRGELSRFLWTRGLWLVVLELTVIRFLLYFSFSFPLVLTVFWALGWSMAALAALVYLPLRAIAGISLAMIALHNVLDSVRAADFGGWAWVWIVVHQPGVIRIGGTVVIPGYPLVPWIGVMGAGYCCGSLFLMDAERRRALLIRIGAALTAAFVLLRALNFYGDPARWSVQPSGLFTALSFLNCTKYPPSLLFLLMTLGPALLALGLLEGVRVSDKNPVLIFGRAPFFYYVIHLGLAHLALVLLTYLRYGATNFLFTPPPTLGGPRQAFPADAGFSLGTCYAVWFALLIVVYPLCRWFAGVKQRRKDWWLSYL